MKDSERLLLAIAVAALIVSLPLWVLASGTVTMRGGAPTVTPFVAQPTATFRASPGWDDLRIEPNVRGTAGNFTPSYTKIYSNTGTRGVFCYEFDDAAVNAEKEVYFTMQMPHAWRLGSPVHLHTHWTGWTTQASKAVVWGLEYTWAEPVTGLFTHTATITASVAEGGVTNITEYVHNLTEFAVITPTTNSDNVSTIMLGRLFRNSSAAADTYTGSACLLYIDAHFIVDSMGSISEYAK